MIKEFKFSSTNLLLTFGVAAFIFNTITRMSIYELTGLNPGKFIAYGDGINFLAIFCVIGILLLNMRRPPYMISILVLFLYSLGIIISNSHNKTGLMVYFTSVLPAFILLCVRFRKIDVNKIFKSFLRIYNIVIILALSFGIIDFFLKGTINQFIADYMSTESWGNMIRKENSVYGFRMITVMGSPLMNAFYAMVFLVLNNIYETTYHKKLLNKYFVYSFAIIAIALTGSRSALVLALIYIICTELVGRIKIFEIIVILGLLISIFNTSLFESTVYSRFQLGFFNETDARSLVMQNFMANRYGDFGILSGGGYNYSRELTATLPGSTLNFEYPLLMFLFDNGAMVTLAYYFFIIGLPVYSLLRMKKFKYLFGYLILAVYLNTFNVIAQYYDFNLALAFLQVLLIWLAKEKSNKNKVISKGQ
ncbi:hypothetical protein [Priestia megaterium]|uniref:hypothetical protein n=1 Tax=Priestia megaterium TaxID=1404 RepID=UPI002FFFB189